MKSFKNGAKACISQNRPTVAIPKASQGIKIHWTAFVLTFGAHFEAGNKQANE